MELPWKKSKRLKLEAAKKKQEEELQVYQEQIGLSIEKLMQEAANKNEVYNLFKDGQRSASVKKMIVRKITANGGSFTLVAGLPCDEVWTGSIIGVKGYPAYQVDIQLKRTGKELHMFTCPYGPDLFQPLNELDNFKDNLRQKVENFTLYPKS